MKELLEAIAAVKARIEEGLKAKVSIADLEAKHAAMKTELSDMEKRILQQIPAASGKPIHDQKNQDRTQIVKQLKFIIGHSQKSLLDPGVEAQAKALSVEVGSDGGFLVPDEFRAEIIRKLVKRSIIRPNARVFSGVQPRGSMPRETGTVTVSWVGENVEAPPTTQPTFGQLAWTTKKVRLETAVPLPLIDNSAIDVLDLLSDMFAEQLEIEEDKVFMTGSGSDRPTGLRTITTGITSVPQAGASLAYDDLVDIKHALKVQYRANAVWIMHNDIIALIAKLKDTQNRPIFVELQSKDAGFPDQTVGRLLGLPVLEHADIPVNLGGGTNESEIWFGDLQKYFIFDEGRMEMGSSTEGTFWKAEQMGVKLVNWLDAKIGQAEGFVFGSGIK